MHIFYVQGGGLGHLTRIDKLIKTLSIPKEAIKIITPSSFTNYFKDYQFIKLSWSETPNNWTKQIAQVLNKYSVSSFYIDAFPLGLKGELLPVYKVFTELNYIYISRILKWETYLKAMNNETPSVIFSKTMVLEQLYETHLDWIVAHSKNVLHLHLKPKGVISIPFINSDYIMVVHSGGTADVLKICNKAIEDYKHNPNISIIVFTQVDIQLKSEKIVVYKNIFPVTQYYDHAKQIYTAGGFNSVHELELFRYKHNVIPLEKRFDDQFFRISINKSS
ncbi:hypothetical protein [Algibacter sp. R77976]|uniref:hypothetical protein n=1 Tax=Algibacter sp. R77976 TaxID=3093873 RepID=UPI0037C6C168